MTPLKKAIFNEVRRTDSAMIQQTDDELNKLMFRHEDSYRLLLSGFIIIKKIFTAYSYDVPITLKTKHYMGLAVMDYPYFITPKRLVLFSEDDALMIALHGGLQGFLENCFKTVELKNG